MKSNANERNKMTVISSHRLCVDDGKCSYYEANSIFLFFLTFTARCAIERRLCECEYVYFL
jgi:hypothetical protein